MPITTEECLQAQCGVPVCDEMQAYCAETGQVGSRACVDPECAPFRGNIPGCTLPQMPRPTSMLLPTIVTAPHYPEGTALTPEMLNQKLPSIIDRTPVEMEPEPCTFAQWVEANPLLALFGLVGVSFLIKGVVRN